MNFMKSMTHPRLLTRLLGGCLLAAGMAAPALADDFPSRPITMIVPFPPGGSTDISTRLLAAEMGKYTSQPIVVENRPGNGGAIGITRVARAAPDGYTLGISGIGPTILLNLTDQNNSYDPLKDLSYVAEQNKVDFVFIARKSLPAKNLKEAIELAKAKPETISFGNSGISSPSHLTYEMMAAAAGIKGLVVPYKGESDLLKDVMGGTVDIGVATVPGASEAIKAGAVKALGVAGATRNPILPDVPTVAESGVPGFDTSTWQVIVGPAGVPADRVQKLNELINKALATQTIKDKYMSFGMTVMQSTPAEAEQFARDETAKWKASLGLMKNKAQ